MFTGIITGVGRIVSVQSFGNSQSHGKQLTIACPASYLDDVVLGDSIALNGALLAAGLVDEIVLYLAPKMLGRGRDMASFGPLSALSEAVALEFISSDRLGPDLRLVARIAGRDRF